MNDLVRKIIDSVSLEDIVMEYVPLEEKGVQLVGCCPFHVEKTPSFHIKKGAIYYKCFGCGITGDALQFLQDHPQVKMTFKEAVEHLATRAEITVNGFDFKPDPKREEKMMLDVINSLTNDGYMAALATKHKKYFIERGFTEETILKFNIGFSGDKLPDSLSTYNEETLQSSGLLSKKGNPVFFNRLIFPLHDRMGKVIGFAGRKFDNRYKNISKYANSPETIKYRKRENLYNLHRAAEAIAKEKSAILVEGYTDVMAVDQIGMQNVLGLCTTSITNEQIKLLKRYTKNIIVCMDGSAIEEAIKIIEKAVSIFNVRIVVLPVEHDPASFIKRGIEEGRQETAAQWRTLIGEAENGLIWLAQREAALGGEDPDRKFEASKRMAELVASIEVEGRRENYVKQVASILDTGAKQFAKLVQEELPEKKHAKDDNKIDNKIDRHIKIKDTFFEFGVDYNPETKTYDQEYLPRKAGELERETSKEYLSKISRFNKIVVIPCHGSEYKRVFVHQAYDMTFRHFNWYKPLPFEAKEYKQKYFKLDSGEVYPVAITNTVHFFHHIFGDKIELGWDYFALLYLKPAQRLQALCLVSREEGTGKSTLVNYWLRLFGQNATKTSARRLNQNFNNQLFGKLLICIEETKDEKGQIENNLKDLITSEVKVIEPKFSDSFTAAAFDKYIFCSNHPETFMKVSANTTRFAVLEIKPPAKKVTNMLELMVAEIPATLAWLNKRGIKTPCGDRLWFKPELWENEALMRLKRASRNITIQVVEEFIELIWVKARYKQKELRLSSRILAKYLNYYSEKQGKYTANGISRMLGEAGYAQSKHSTSFNYPMLSMSDHDGWAYQTKTETNRYFTFSILNLFDVEGLKTSMSRDLLEDIFTNKELEEIGIVFPSDVPF